MTTFNFSELTSAELQAMLDTLDAIHALDALAEERHVVPDGDDIELADLSDAIVEEMNNRQVEDVSFACEQAVAEGHMERVILPDGQVAYQLTDAGTTFVEGLGS